MLNKKILALIIITATLILATVYIVRGDSKNYIRIFDEERFMGVHLTVHAPFSESTISIYANGSTRYTASTRGEEPSTTESLADVISQKDIGLLVQRIEAADRSSSNNPTTQTPDLSDGSKCTVEIWSDPEASLYSADAAQHELSCYESKCSKDFLLLKSYIIDLYGEEPLEIGV